MAVKFQDYYETMCVSRSATQEEIKRAFRDLARKYHPDRNKAPEAEQKMKQLNEAYEVLKDPQKRARYDELGANYKNGQEFRPPPGYEESGYAGPGGGFRMSEGEFSDFFEAFFGGQSPLGGAGGAGGGKRARQRGRARAEPQDGGDVEAEITISVEDAFGGATRQINLQGPEGVRSLHVKIPPGTTDGATIRLAGQGQPGAYGGEPGDLRLKVRIAPHPRYEVQGHDLTADVKLTPWEAALGAKVDVQTLDGVITLTVPPGAQSGQKLRVKGKGLPLRGKGGGGEVTRGDLFVRLMIAVPKNLSDEERQAFERLKEVSTFNPRV